MWHPCYSTGSAPAGGSYLADAIWCFEEARRLDGDEGLIKDGLLQYMEAERLYVRNFREDAEAARHGQALEAWWADQWEQA
eukprot:11333383-Alexandrium_andersonii.AAC.1